CLNVCPVYRRIGGHAYDAVYSGPMGAVLTPLLSGGTEARDLPDASSLCGACSEACPVGIPLADLLVRLRADLRTPGPAVPPAPPWPGHGPDGGTAAGLLRLGPAVGLPRRLPPEQRRRPPPGPPRPAGRRPPDPAGEGLGGGPRHPPPRHPLLPPAPRRPPEGRLVSARRRGPERRTHRHGTYSAPGPGPT